MKHVERTKSGSFQYRRRVPKVVAGIIAKREFKRKLGDTEREALKAWPIFHAQVEREIAEALRQGAKAAPTQTEREAYQEALRQLRTILPDDAADHLRDAVVDQIVARYRLDAETGNPINAAPVDRHAINILRSGPDRYPRPEPILSDALNLYLAEHLHEDSPETDKRVVGLTRRVVGAVIEALGRDPALSAITREDARQVRDHMLDRVKETGRGVGAKVSATTVSREISIISAVINFARSEFGISAAVQNPFSRLPVARVAKGHGQKASEKRDPLPPAVLAKTRQRVLANASPELALIWRIIEGTGCRLAEVTGLRVEDVHTTGELPHIRIEPNPLRSLKTESSRRLVPLVGDALEAAREALTLPRGGDMLFPAYGRRRGSDTASASLMKHLRKVSTDEKHVIHSLRHNMKDMLIIAEVSSLDQNLILGHALGGVGDRVYGGDVAKLRRTTEAMKRALKGAGKAPQPD